MELSISLLLIYLKFKFAYWFFNHISFDFPFKLLVFKSKPSDRYCRSTFTFSKISQKGGCNDSAYLANRDRMLLIITQWLFYSGRRITRILLGSCKGDNSIFLGYRAHNRCSDIIFRYLRGELTFKGQLIFNQSTN